MYHGDYKRERLCLPRAANMAKPSLKASPHASPSTDGQDCTGAPAATRQAVEQQPCFNSLLPQPKLRAATTFGHPPLLALLVLPLVLAGLLPRFPAGLLVVQPLLPLVALMQSIANHMGRPVQSPQSFKAFLVALIGFWGFFPFQRISVKGYCVELGL